MLIAERQSRLVEILAARGIADLDSLAADLGVSQSTVRRDLDALEQRHLVRRTHGGVIWEGDRTTGARPYAFDQRMGHKVDAKRRIARAACKLVQPGHTVLLDGGTTTYYLAEQLVGQTMQLVTNSLPIAQLFLNDENVEVILSGGILYPRYGVLLGPLAESAFQSIHTQMMFMSVAGIQDDGLYNQNQLLVHAERRMMQQSQEIVLLVDGSKFNQQALARVGGLDEIDVVVADAVTDAQRAQIEKAGCRLILAEDAPG